MNKIKKDPTNKAPYFVSELDEFLREFDRQHPQPSDSQKRSMEEQKRIAYLRDNIVPMEKRDKLWEGF